MRRYEQSIRVVIAFFTALMGFGLKNLLDGKTFPAEMVAPCFVLSVLLFLRFLLGSANHFWYEYLITDTVEMDDPVRGVKKSKPEAPRWVLFDLLGLILFGLIGTFTCYATTLHGFLAAHFALAAIAILWCAVYFKRKAKTTSPGWRSVVFIWLPVNFVQIVVIVAAWCDFVSFPAGNLPIPELGWFPWPAWSLKLTALVVCYALVLCVDAYFGLAELLKAQSS